MRTTTNLQMYKSEFQNPLPYHMNNYIVRLYRDVIVVTKIPTRRTIKAQSIVMY